MSRKLIPNNLRKSTNYNFQTDKEDESVTTTTTSETGTAGSGLPVGGGTKPAVTTTEQA